MNTHQRITNMEDERFSFSHKADADNSKWVMIDLLPSMSGLPMITFALSKSSVSDDNGPRLRVSCHNDPVVDTATELYSIFFGKTYITSLKGTYVASQVVQFILDNREALLSFWNEEINPAQFYDMIKPLKE